MDCAPLSASKSDKHMVDLRTLSYCASEAILGFVGADDDAEYLTALESAIELLNYELKVLKSPLHEKAHRDFKSSRGFLFGRFKS